MELSAYMLVWLAAACPWAALAPTAVERALVYEPTAYEMVEMVYGYPAGASVGLAAYEVGIEGPENCRVYLWAPPLAETACHELRHCVEGAFHG